MADVTEIAPRVWVAHYPWMQVNITVVGSDRGLLVVDTYGSERAAAEVLTDVRRLGAGPVVAVVNTHEHWDHTFGNAALLDAYAGTPIHATTWAAEHTIEAGERIKRVYGGSDDEHADEVLRTRIRSADHTFVTEQRIDLGDREVRLCHPGRGHTGGDLIVHIPDADVLAAGDLVEEADHPWFGIDCYPLDWPASLDRVRRLLTSATVVVPGHGAPVDRDFVQEQRSDVGVVAETIRDLATRGVPLAEALAAADWPFPREGLAEAVRLGYEHLPRSQKRLPLV